ncbi:hypothetical protein C7448_10758 [Tenacibaculum gallaicum]|uniref:Uncharacterized protein n=1 Tax=Tenacibaculum gallaicum TaxID=561505 RepID=A0A3E0HJD2_9FLAO|nr:hypothetical protein [Tenacibaculum gallaicum]REH46498.1 hypothetical protein C7448_10758 [Tenacibaculum gallaicum]
MIDIKLDKTKVATYKRKKTKKSEPLEIRTSPYKINLKDVDYFLCLNDKYYAFDYYVFKDDLKWGGGIILFSIILHFGVGGGFSFEAPFPITAPIFLFGLCFIIKTFIVKNRKLILSRMDGLFSYPNYMSNKPVVIRFKEAALFFAYKGKMAVPVLVAPYTNVKFGGFTLSTVDVNSELSFYVWYMDKNRPLPPGDAFDAYRQKDFERRKAEGFPPPLYYSCGIPTPEATPEQQAEREQYWKDEEYYAPDIKRPKDSEIFNKRTHKNWSPCVFGEKETILANKWYEFTFANGKVVYMLTNEKGEGFLPPEDEKYEVASLTLKDTWF